MAAFYEELSDDLAEFIGQQHIFFVASAAANGRINLSPKGMDSFLVLSPTQVAFLNVTGSGNETAAHLAQNGRLTIMFCSFAKRPLILRLYGTGTAVHPRDAAWSDLYGRFAPIPGARQIITLDIDSVQTSCGFAVPFFSYEGERDTLRKWANTKGTDGIEAYWQEKNVTSIDGLPTYLLEKS